jgi:hypothetical protein
VTLESLLILFTTRRYPPSVPGNFEVLDVRRPFSDALRKGGPSGDAETRTTPCVAGTY